MHAMLRAFQKPHVTLERPSEQRHGPKARGDGADPGQAAKKEGSKIYSEGRYQHDK